MFCTKCGSELVGTGKFCAECGSPAQSQQHSSPLLTSKESRCDDQANTDLRILLVGHTGHGKSATGNTLLGEQDLFEHARARKNTSVTKTANRKVGHRFGRKIEIVDTPGFFDSSHDDTFVHKELTKCIGLTIPGFNAICFVMRPDRFSEEIVKTVDMFFDFFGEGVDDFAFVLLTFTEDDDEKSEFLGLDDNDRHPKLKELIKRCKDKVLIIDNNKHLPKDHKEQMASNIISEIDKATSKLNQPYFTNEMINGVDRLAREMHEKKEKPSHASIFPNFIKKIFNDLFNPSTEQKQVLASISSACKDQADNSKTEIKNDYREEFKQNIERRFF